MTFAHSAFHTLIRFARLGARMRGTPAHFSHFSQLFATKEGD